MRPDSALEKMILNILSRNEFIKLSEGQETSIDYKNKNRISTCNIYD